MYGVVGVFRFLNYRGFFYEMLEGKSPMLLILPIEITEGKFPYKTSYIVESENMPMDKLVFSRSTPLAQKCYRFTIFKRFRVLLALNLTLFSDFFKTIVTGKFNAAYLDGFTILFRWVVAQGWFFHWDFYHLLKNLCLSSPRNYKALVSAHEMSFYPKMIWQVAKEAGLVGVTAQHAMIYPGKLNFFLEAAEIEAGSPQPDIFFVYNSAMIDLLKPYFPKTSFLLCCSPRFNNWKNQKAFIRNHHGQKNILFVSGVMFYDVQLLLAVIKKLMRENNICHSEGRSHSWRSPEELRFLLRFHPDGNIRIVDRIWLFVAEKLGKVEKSVGPLEETLKQTSLVVGSNTTTLQEAVLLGIPALNIFNEDFLCVDVLSLSQNCRVHINDISVTRLLEQMNAKPDPEMIESYKAFMGLEHPDFSTDLVWRTVTSFQQPPHLPEYPQPLSFHPSQSSV